MKTCLSASAPFDKKNSVPIQINMRTKRYTNFQL